MIKFRSFILQLIGFVGVVIGWLIAGIEIHHQMILEHKFEAMPFVYSGLSQTLGALMIQTARADKVVDFIISISKRGGKRKYDPPAGFYWKKKKLQQDLDVPPKNGA